MRPTAQVVNKSGLFYVSIQIYLHPNPVKTKQFLSSVPFISYRRVLSLIRALRPIDIYLGDISKSRHSIRGLFKAQIDTGT